MSTFLRCLTCQWLWKQCSEEKNSYKVGSYTAVHLLFCFVMFVFINISPLLCVYTHVPVYIYLVYLSCISIKSTLDI